MIQFPQAPLTDKSFLLKHQRRSLRHVHMAKKHLREDVEQDLCVEVWLQDAHRRDHGPDRDENGSSEEATAHHAPKQTTHDYNIQEHDTIALSLELHGGTGTTDPTEQPTADTEENATHNDAATTERKPPKRRTSEAGVDVPKSAIVDNIAQHWRPLGGLYLGKWWKLQQTNRQPRKCLCIF